MRLLAVACALVVGIGSLWAAQRGKPREDPNVRSVQGAVYDANDQPVEGAIVKLKNLKTLQVRSFVTQRDGTYYFHGLSTDVDYELRAEHGEAASDTKTLSVFDSRRKAVINLKLASKK
ncbi:MAG: carboxypeptidase-like regulatory domain-containing protein [Bryobacterales bacterium]|nr:carboxypeptidase-like regulatory domain-containing protein [Bryobacteraceae bacterium]MDW8355287.1 carboxypeptidase-like regulatory domain-containing protein [Bryobacterales bacterium]